MSRFCLLFAALSLASAGCGGYVAPTEIAEVDVSGSVTGPDGKPVTGLNIVFQPASAGAQQNAFLLGSGGSFSGKLKAGTYTYFLAPKAEGDRAGESALGKMPDSVKTPVAEKTVEAKAGAKLEIKF